VEVLEHIEDATALMNAIIFDSQPAERPSSLTINKLEATSSDPANLKEVIEAFKLESEELGGNAAGDIMTSSTLSVLSEESDPDTFLIEKASSETSSPLPQPSSSPWYTSLLTIDDLMVVDPNRAKFLVHLQEMIAEKQAILGDDDLSDEEKKTRKLGELNLGEDHHGAKIGRPEPHIPIHAVVSSLRRRGSWRGGFDAERRRRARDDPQRRRVRRTYPRIRRRQRYPEANRGFPQRL